MLFDSIGFRGTLSGLGNDCQEFGNFHSIVLVGIRWNKISQGVATYWESSTNRTRYRQESGISSFSLVHSAREKASIGLQWHDMEEVRYCEG